MPCGRKPERKSLLLNNLFYGVFMKKFLTALLLTCSCVLVGAACKCKKDKDGAGDPRSVTFSTGEGYTFYSNVSEEGTVNEGSQLTFEVELGAFYAGNLTAYVNDTIVNPDADGIYSYTVGKDDLTVRLEGVRKDVSNMSGSGTLEDAYVVSRPIDLVYIAEQVNKGDTHFATASYVLANDIDCKGEELQIIGDYSSQQAVFSGSFASGVDEEGVRQRYTISNFSINAEDKNYVGLFGTVFADMSVESSGLIYGICLDGFTINAGVNDMLKDEKSVSCGGLVGYAVGANFYLCDATNGEINLVADNNYFSFVGGLVGYQQGVYNESYGVYNPTEISYSNVDVDVTILGGVALYAGGITGFATTNYPYGATAAIHNSYSTGSVTGALRSGGVVGGLGRYSVVSNCYATGEITARSYQSADSLLLNSLDYCHTYAGGIVGYAENDTIAHDSFFNGSVSAFTVSDKLPGTYAHSNTAIGGGDEAGTAAADGVKYISHNNHASIDLSTKDFLTGTLGWSDYNWSFADGKTPLINYNSTDATIVLNLTLKYVADGSPVKVQGKTELTQKYFDTSIQSLNSYNPLGSFMGSGSLPLYSQADDATENKVLRSYGYFFDEACTKRVPVGYMPMKDVTLYVGFANVMPVVGTYQLLAPTTDEVLKLELKKDGTAVYDDGTTKLTASYGYDGERIILEGVRLARYYDGEIVINQQDTTTFQDESFDRKRYDLYNFVGVMKTEGLELFDGVYFTENKPLKASKNVNAGQTQYDVFKGTWVSASTVNKVYTFDGTDKWSFKQIVNERSGYYFSQADKHTANGDYSINLAKDQISFTHDGIAYTATFEDGFLEITGNGSTQIYYAQDSYKGRWKSVGFDLVLNGITRNGYGEAQLITSDGFATQLLYEVSETAGILAFYTPLKNDQKGYLYGYARYIAEQNALYFVYPSEESSTGFTTSILYLYDDFYGEWVCDHADFVGVDFDFNGLGLYSQLSLNGLKGILTLTDGNEVAKVEYQLDTSLSGKFSYKSKTYEITFDEINGRIMVNVVSVNNDQAILQQKDEFGGLDLVDKTGTKFCDIDGRSTLGLGSFLFEGTTYYYVKAANPADGYDVKATPDGGKVGSIVRVNNHYELSFLAGGSTELYVANDFMAKWAIGGQYALFEIGPTDLNGIIHATFKGTPVQLTFLDPATLTFEYKENKMPYTYYVYIVPDEQTKEDVLVVSEYVNFMLGDYLLCTKANELYGSWEWNQDGGKTSIRFDGVTTSYANGSAELVLTLNHQTITTKYYYSIRKTGIVFWSQELMADRTWYFRLDLVDISHKHDADAFVLRNEQGDVVKVMKRTPVDGLYLTEAQDAEGVKYIFNGDGKMFLLNEDGSLTDTVKYFYTIKSYNENRTATLEVVEKATGKKYTATLDYKDASNIKFILGDEITE